MSWEAWGTPDDFYGPDWRDDATGAGWLDPDDLGKAALDVLAERERQEAQEGWSMEHDDGHQNGEMAAAAAAYAFNAYCRTSVRSFAADPVGFWPWDLSWWKPTTPRRDLIKAAALILAEIERIDRAADKAEGTS